MMERDGERLSRSLPFADLAAREEHLRLAQEAGEIGTWEWDLRAGRMHWSAQMFRNLGLAPRVGGDLHRLMIDAVHPEDRAHLRAQLREFAARPGPMRIETRVVWPGGEVHWIVALGSVLADAAGRPRRMLGITIDGTRRRRGEETARDRLRRLNESLEHEAEQWARQLAASRAQMQAFFDNSPDWLTLFRATPDGHFVYEGLNRATEVAYGLSREQVLGRTVEAVLGREQAELPLRHMRACAETGRTQRYTAHRTMAGATRAIDVMFVRVAEPRSGDFFIIATARDITEREAIEEQLRQAQKMEVVGQLTGGLAHDFNNLLTAITGNLELLAARLAGDPGALGHLEAAQRAADNGARLTQQLLAFSRRQHLQPRSVDLNAVVAGMRSLLSRTIGATIEIRVDLAADPWPALVDPTQIEIALLNLAINARDAMPSGGLLTIETRNLDGVCDAVPAELDGRDCVRVTVRDTGLGMTEEVRRSAVEPFFTTKELGKGSGLGLSQVYGMVRQSNGCLAIDSLHGEGTAVHLFLPRAEAAAEPFDEARAVPPRDRRGGRVLVVDDDPAVREVAAGMLLEAGYKVVEADGGQAALDLLAAGETCDLMVIDIAMPGLDGIETARRARDLAPGLRVLYVTGYAGPAAERRALGDPMIRKPFRAAALIAAVATALGRRSAGAA